MSSILCLLSLPAKWADYINSRLGNTTKPFIKRTEKGILTVALESHELGVGWAGLWEGT